MRISTEELALSNMPARALLSFIPPPRPNIGVGLELVSLSVKKQFTFPPNYGVLLTFLLKEILLNHFLL